MCTIFVVVVVKYLRGLPTKSYKNLYIYVLCIDYIHVCIFQSYHLDIYVYAFIVYSVFIYILDFV